MAADARTIFLGAVERAFEARDEYLNESCGGDAALRRRVEALLLAHDEPGAFLGEKDSPADLGATSAAEGLAKNGDRYGTNLAGTTLAGRYKLIEEIGDGGMGTVWTAQQSEPVRRLVAVKLLKPGMDSQAVLRRFEVERQALAVMDHPNIAKVFDGGIAPDGRPFFVMELVKGLPLTEYCDSRRLPVSERLELFVQICAAVRHAHQKAVIHRDLKPSNVLVTEHDGRPVPKVIDFGLAKATSAANALSEKTLHTAFGMVVGTPLYMAPEQVAINSLDVDTRTDIYALGVILYELLTGTTPLEKSRLKTAAWEEVRRLIREEDPPLPSQRLSSTEALPSLAASRRIEPTGLTKTLKGDLDWIVMKALEKDRGRRYESAGDFALDVQRHLAGEAVQAAPPSAAYRLRKYVRKHRLGLAAGTAIALLLAFAVIGTTIGMVRARQEREVAMHARMEAEQARQQEELQRKQAEEQRREAQRNADRARDAAAAEREAKDAAEKRNAESKAVLDFLTDDILASARPAGQDGGLGRDVTLRKAIESASTKVSAGFADKPATEARLRSTLGQSFLYLGEAKSAVEQFERARELYAKAWGPEHLDALRATNNLASAYDQSGRPLDALKMRQEALVKVRAQRGADHPETLGCMNNLAVSLQNCGRREEALKLRQELLGLVRAKFGPKHPHSLGCMNNLASSYSQLDRHEEALELHRQALALRKETLGADHPDALQSMANLADCFRAVGRIEEALRLNQETLTLRRAKLGADHPDTLASMFSLAQSFDSVGKRDEGMKLHEETVAQMKAKLGPDHPKTLTALSQLAEARFTAGRAAEAIRLHEEALALRKAKLGENHPQTLASMNSLAWALATAADVKLRDPARAVELATKAAAGTRSANYQGTLGTAHYRAGDWKRATVELEKAIGMRKADSPQSAAEGFLLAMSHWKLGEKEKAREWFARATKWMAKGTQDDPEFKAFRKEAAELLGVKE